MAIPRAQELNQLITFQTKTGARNAVTGEAAVPITFTTAWAKITAQGGSVEETTQSSEAAVQSFEIWCRYDATVTAFMQIEWGTRHLIITGPPQEVIDSNNRRWMILTAQETTEN